MGDWAVARPWGTAAYFRQQGNTRAMTHTFAVELARETRRCESIASCPAR